MRRVPSLYRLIGLFDPQRLGRDFAARLLQRGPRLVFRRLASQLSQFRLRLVVGMEGLVLFTGFGFEPSQRVEGFGDSRAFHRAGSPDDAAPNIWHHGPTVAGLRADSYLAPDQRPQRDHDGHRYEIGRALHALAYISTPRAQGIGNTYQAERPPR